VGSNIATRDCNANETKRKAGRGRSKKNLVNKNLLNVAFTGRAPDGRTIVSTPFQIQIAATAAVVAAGLASLSFTGGAIAPPKLKHSFSNVFMPEKRPK
jgi:hypothetical protein